MMDALVGKLCDHYRHVLSLYARVLAMTESEREAVGAEKPLAEIIRSLEEKRELLDTIADLDSGVSLDRDRYLRNRSRLDAVQTVRLNEAVGDVKKLIQRILELEVDNERLILDAPDPPIGPTSRGDSGGGDHADHRYAG